eukprot:Em0030g9a
MARIALATDLVSTANGTQVHPSSKHLGSLATCLRDSAATAATPAVEQDPSRMAGLSGDVTVISKVAGKLFSHLVTRTSAGRERLLSCKALDPLGHHTTTCTHGGDVVTRHNLLRDVVANLFRQAHMGVTVEAVSVVSMEKQDEKHLLTSSSNSFKELARLDGVALARKTEVFLASAHFPAMNFEQYSVDSKSTLINGD